MTGAGFVGLNPGGTQPDHAKGSLIHPAWLASLSSAPANPMRWTPTGRSSTSTSGRLKQGIPAKLTKSLETSAKCR